MKWKNGARRESRGRRKPPLSPFPFSPGCATRSSPRSLISRLCAKTRSKNSLFGLLAKEVIVLHQGGWGGGGGRCGPSPSYCTANSRSYFVIKASKIWPRYVVLTFLHRYEPQLFLNCSRLAGCWRLVSRRRSNELS